MSSRTLFSQNTFLDRGKKNVGKDVGCFSGSSLRKLGSNQDVFQSNVVVSDAEAKKFMIGFTPLISCNITTYVSTAQVHHKGKSLSEALLFAEHGENNIPMLCTKIVLNVRNNFCTQHVLPRFELGIFMYALHVCIELVI